MLRLCVSRLSVLMFVGVNRFVSVVCVRMRMVRVLACLMVSACLILGILLVT